MQLIAATALFASAVLAAPQQFRTLHPGLQFGPHPPTSFFGPGNCFSPNPFNPGWVPPQFNNFIQPGFGTDNNGPYKGGCTCQVFQDLSPDIGRDACNNLGLTYTNLVWNECQQVCIDLDGHGIEQSGFTESCQEVTHGFYGASALVGFDLSQFVFARCTSF